MKLLMITGDRALAQGKKGPFYYMLEEFSKYWDRVDIICPKIQRTANSKQRTVIFGNVFVHSSPWSIWWQPWFILKKGMKIYKKEKFDLFTVHSYPPFYNDIGGRLLYGKLRRLLNKDYSRFDTRRSPSEASRSVSPSLLPLRGRPCPLGLRRVSSENNLYLEIPYVLEIMHITGYPKTGSFKEWFYKILERLFVNFFAKRARAVRVINKKETPEFLKKAGVDEKKLKYIPAFYIDFDVFKPQDLPKKYDIVFSGRLARNKGIHLLLLAVQKLKTQIPNVKLVIIGSGPLENKIKRYIKKHRLEKNIQFAGWLPTIKDVAKIYNQSKIFVMPSFNEGGPRVNLEAMACKVPVVTTRVGVMIDIINPSTSSGQGNGLFIDWSVNDIAKKILMLLKDENLRKKIAENGYQTVQQFERRKAIKNYAQTYKNLLYSA